MVIHYLVTTCPLRGFLLLLFFFSALQRALTITGQIVGTHNYPLRASTVERPRDVKAIVTAAAISARAFVSVYREYTIVRLKEILSR